MPSSISNTASIWSHMKIYCSSLYYVSQVFMKDIIRETPFDELSGLQLEIIKLVPSHALKNKSVLELICQHSRITNKILCSIFYQSK